MELNGEIAARAARAGHFAQRTWLLALLLLGVASGAQAQTSITLSPGTLPDGVVGEPYGESITASGGVGPYTFALENGSPPPGLTLDPTGLLSGTPTATYDNTFEVSATDVFGVVGTGLVALRIDPAPTIDPPTLPDAVVGESYSQDFSVSNGTGSYSFSIAGGELPPGLSLAPRGTLDGVPEASGNFGFTVMATPLVLEEDPLLRPATQALVAPPGAVTASYTLAVAGVVVLSPTTLPDGNAGVAYAQDLFAAGGAAPYDIHLVSGTLPPGLVLTPTGSDSARLEGTPTTDGDYSFVLGALDANGAFDTNAYDVSIAAPVLALSPSTLPGGAVGTPYAQDLVASGGMPPYNIHLVSGSLPYGLELVATGPDSVRLEGTPTTDGDFAFVLGAMDANGFVVSNSYDVAIAAPVITLAPAMLPDAPLGVPYAQTITASGGTSPYSFFIGGGSLPPGLELGSGGTLAGMPTALGDFAFTVIATGAFGYQGSIDYTLAVTADPPVAVDDVAETAARQPVVIAVTANDSGGIEAISIASGPSHGSASVDGLAVTYTPTGDFFGDDGFTYVASGPGGSASPATVTVHVAPLPVPVGVPQSVVVPAGGSVSFDAAEGATGGPIIAVTIVQPPAQGSASVAGTQVTYSAPADASGTQEIGYVLSNAFGDSAAVVSTVAVDARPEAPTLHATTPMGVAVELDLTSGASGGPFVDADVQEVLPAGAGTATILDDGDGGLRLRFAPAAAFSGDASVVFTLSNAHATSDPGTAIIAVTERDDPTLDPGVGGVIRAQVFTVREFAQAQITNVQQRLEELHEPGDRPWGFWIGGTIRRGDRDGDGGAAPASFETSGLTSGADYRFSDRFAFGGALGHARDRTAIGNEGGRSDGRAESALGYGSFKPSLPFYLDGMAGHQRITFQLQRVDAATGEVITMPRDGVQSFSSWSSGYEHRNDRWMLGSYGRMDVSQARLDAYEETGDPLQALAFDEMAIQTRTSTLGLRGRFKREIRWGTLEPKFRIEFQRDFHDASGQVIRYADQDGGQAYVLPADGFDRSRAILELGSVLRLASGMVLRLELRSVRGGLNDNDNAISVSLQDDH